MWKSERQLAVERTRFLMERELSAQLGYRIEEERVRTPEIPTRGLALFIYQAGLPVYPWLFALLSIISGVAVGWSASLILSPYIVPVFALAGACIPYVVVESRVSKRAQQFARDYPTVLLATASSIKVGLTPYMALERSIKLLPKESLVRQEVERLVNALRRGVAREEAIARFGVSIRQPDLALFRAAFLLVMENGGRFAPTLMRLASVSKDRSVLIASALVSTATMRMTANVLLFIAPCLLIVVSSRSDDFWRVFLHHPVANVVASVGIMIIAISYVVLTKMSAFKP